VKRFGLTLLLQDDPQKIALYKGVSPRGVPEVKARLQECGVQSMHIFLRGTRMFMYITTDDTFDPARDFARINEDPVSARWNELMVRSRRALRKLLAMNGGRRWSSSSTWTGRPAHHPVSR